MGSQSTKYQKVLLLSLTYMLFAMYSVLALADSPVWKVSKGENVIYLGGTIHVLSKKDYPLPEQFNQAYQQAHTLVFETDIEAANDPAMQAKFAPLISLPTNQTLSSLLNAETAERLDKFLQQRNMSLQQFQSITPIGVSLTLTVVELQRMGIDGSSGVDSFYNLRGKNEGKTIEWLESIDDQIGFLSQFNQEDPNLVINNSLRDLERINDMWSKMISYWRTGDIDALDKFIIKQMQKDSAKLTDLLLKHRNDNWLEKIPAMLADKDVEFVLVGMLHMAGEDGLINQLIEQGYRVERF